MKKINYQKLYIALEGMDGSGKTTTLTDLNTKLFIDNKNLTITLTREPNYATKEGKEIRKRLESQEGIKNAKILAKLFAENRKKCIDNIIIPDLENNKLVLSDRCYLSTYMYQGTVQGVSYENIYKFHKGLNKYPDLIIIFDLPVKKAIERLNIRPETQEAFDKEEWLYKQQKAYKEIPKFLKKTGLKQNIAYIDASQEKEERLQQCIKIINKHIMNK
jgi:dTMP kinase